MIFDLQTRVWPSIDRLGRETAQIIRRTHASRWIRDSAEPEQLHSCLDCVDGAFVLAYQCLRQDACIPNEWVADVVKTMVKTSSWLRSGAVFLPGWTPPLSGGWGEAPGASWGLAGWMAAWLT